MEYIFYTLLYAFLLYITGYFILNLCRINIKELYLQLFISNVIGMIVWVWAVACVRTHGATVMNAIWIPIAGVAFYLHKNKLWFQGKVKFDFRIHFFHFLWIIAVVGISIITYLFYLGNSISNPAMGNIDTVYYARLSEFIYYTGIESTNIDYIQIKPNIPNPYHYFTPWLQAAFNAIFHVENNYLVRKVIIFSIYFSNIYIGLLALLKVVIKNKHLSWYHFFIPIFAFFIKPIGLGSITAKIYGSYALYWMNSLIQLPKYSPIVVIILLFVLLVLKRHYVVALIVLLFLPIFYITTAPVVYVLVGIIILWAWIKKIKELYYLPFIVSIVLLGYFALFYGMLPKQNYVVNPSGNTSNFWERFYDIKFLTVFFKDFVQLLFVWMLSLSLIIPISLFFYREVKKEITSTEGVRFIVLFSLISFPVSFLVWQLFYTISDSEQFMASFISPVYMIFVFLWVNLLIELLIKYKRAWLITLLGVYAIMLVSSSVRASISEIKTYKNNYSHEYINYIQKNKHRFSEYGAIMIDNRYIWYVYFHAFPNPYSQNKYPRDFLAINVCELQPTQESYDLDKLYIPLFPFYQYVEKQKSEGKFVSLSQSKLEFMRRYKINHLVANKGVVIDSTFVPYIKEKYVDSYSGEQLYFMDIPQK